MPRQKIRFATCVLLLGVAMSTLIVHAATPETPATLPAPVGVTQLGHIKPGDVLLLYAFDLEQPGQWAHYPIRVDEDGNARLPILSTRIKIATLALSQAEDIISKAYVAAQLVPKMDCQLFRISYPDGTVDPKLLLPDPPPAHK